MKMKYVFVLLIQLTSLLLSAQYVGIGNRTPSEKLHVDSGNIKIGRVVWTPGNDRFLKFGDGDFVSIGEAGLDDRLQFTAAEYLFLAAPGGLGKIGINTSGSPTAYLEVNGNVKITDGTQGANKVLTSDATGQASWQPSAINSGFKATLSSAGQIIPNVLQTQINFDMEDYDDPNAFSLATSRFTAPADGLYHFDSGITWNITSFAAASNFAIIVNIVGIGAVQTSLVTLSPGASGYYSTTISYDLQLSTGQLVFLSALQTSGIPQSIRGNSSALRYSYFSGRRIY